MKQLIGVVLLIQILLSTCSLSTQKNSLSEMELNGNVKTLSESHYSTKLKFGVQEKDALRYRNFHEFDTNGNLVQSSNYGQDGELVYREKSEFNSDGRLIELNRYYGSGELEYRKIFSRSMNGEYASILTYDKHNRRINKEAFEYSGDTLLRRFEYYQTGEVKWKFTYEYDKSGKIISTTKYDSAGIKVPTARAVGWGLKEFFDQDKNGNWTRASGISEICEREIEYY